MEITRKQFLTDWVRYILIAVIAIISGMALHKNTRSGTSGCPPGSICRGCNKAGSCNEQGRGD